MGQTIVEKIAKSHLMEGPARPLRAGDVVSLRPRHVLTHDNTSAVMKKFEAIGAPAVADADQPVFVLDHDIQNRSDANLDKYARIEAFALEHGIRFYPAGTGIGHQIMVSHGFVVPGALVVGSDSHSNMYGALAAIGTPVVRTDAAGEVLWSRTHGGGGVTGWDDASETFNVTLELAKRGYSEEDIRKMWGGNLLRVWRDVGKVAAEIQAG